MNGTFGVRKTITEMLDGCLHSDFYGMRYSHLEHRNPNLTIDSGVRVYGNHT